MKRYVAEWKDKKIVLTEEDYKTLLERFDIRNFKLEEDLYINEVFCPLCKKHLVNSRHCGGCTFNKFYNRGRLGCLKILDQISEEIKAEQCLELLFDTVNFRSKHFDEATKITSRIRVLLMSKFKLVGRQK